MRKNAVRSTWKERLRGEESLGALAQRWARAVTRDLPRTLPLLSVFAGDLRLFCDQENVPLTQRLREAQAEVQLRLANIATGETEKRRATPWEGEGWVPPFDKVMEYFKAYRGLHRRLPNQKSRAMAYREAAKVAAEGEDGGWQDLAAPAPLDRTARLLRRIDDAVSYLETGVGRVRRCRMCPQGFVFLIGRRRPKDCEACRVRLSRQQRWYRRTVGRQVRQRGRRLIPRGTVAVPLP